METFTSKDEAERALIEKSHDGDLAWILTEEEEGALWSLRETTEEERTMAEKALSANT